MSEKIRILLRSFLISAGALTILTAICLLMTFKGWMPGYNVAVVFMLVLSGLLLAALIGIIVITACHKRGRSFIFSIIAGVVILMALGALAYGVVWVEGKVNATKDNSINISDDVQSDDPVLNDDDFIKPDLYDPNSPETDINDPISAEKIQGDVDILKRDRISEDVINILVMGRDGTDGSRGRSDSMMIFSYNKKTTEVWLISCLRDSLIYVDGYGWTKLGHAYAYGGPGLAINTINKNFDLDIQNYVLLDFEGMVDIVNKLGGVNVPISSDESAYYSKHFGWSLPVGESVRLNGEQALRHARNRSLDGTDFERARRQRDIMQAIYRELLKKDIPTAYDVIDYSLTIVKTNLEADTIKNMAYDALTKSDRLYVGTTQMPADGTWTYATYGYMSVTKIDPQANTDMIYFNLYQNCGTWLDKAKAEEAAKNKGN